MRNCNKRGIGFLAKFGAFGKSMAFKMVGLLFIQCFYLSNAHSDITINVGVPAQNSVQSEDFYITAQVISTYEVSSVTAAIDGLSIPLTYDLDTCQPNHPCLPWVGLLPLSHLQPGKKTLLITASDVLGSTATIQVYFVYAQKPEISITSPVNFDVATPDIQINSVCNLCESLVVEVSGKIIAMGRTNINQIVSLGEWNGQIATLTITGRSSDNIQSTLSKTIYIESSPMLSAIAKVPGLIKDADEHRILYIDGETGILRIRHRVSGVDESLSTADMSPVMAYLTPVGAMFTVQNPDNFLTELYDWNQGTLVDRGQMNSPSSLKTIGNYAIWNSGNLHGQDLHLLEFSTGVDAIIANDAGNIENSVARNGLVAFWTCCDQYNIKTYQNGSTRNITNDTELSNVYPLTDGAGIVYAKAEKCCLASSQATYLYDGNEEIKLSASKASHSNPSEDYQITNGWVAYRSEASDGSLQVWLRSPSGVLRQATFFGTSSRIAKLSGTGQLFFNNATNIYYDNGSYHPLVVGTDLIHPFYLKEAWHTAVGNTLFEISASGNTLSVTVNGRGVVVSYPNGVYCNSNCSAGFPLNAGVSLSPQPEHGYKFTGWSGACSGSGSCYVTLDAAKSVVANFSVDVPNMLLDVTRVGAGTITSTPAGIDCGSICSAFFSPFTTVSLTPKPDSGFTFTGWGGDCFGKGSCVVTMNGHHAVSAEFQELPRYRLKVIRVTAGTVTSTPAGIVCGGRDRACTGQFSAVTLTAAPNAGYGLRNWVGCPNSNGPVCTLTLTGPATLKANFAKLPKYTLKVTKTRNGKITSAPAGLNCGYNVKTCSARFVSGTAVTLTATPKAGKTFTGWTGACSGAADCTVTLHGNQGVGAVFQ